MSNIVAADYPTIEAYHAALAVEGSKFFAALDSEEAKELAANVAKHGAIVHPAVEQAPSLEIDKQLFKDRPIFPRAALERKVVWNLLKFLQANRFELVSIYDGEEKIKVHNYPLQAMELIFNLDEISLRVRRCREWESKDVVNRNPIHGILLVLGNDGWDAVSDWNYSDGDADGFCYTMDAFDGERFVKE